MHTFGTLTSITGQTEFGVFHAVIFFLQCDRLCHHKVTFNPIGIKRRAEHATKDLAEALV